MIYCNLCKNTKPDDHFIRIIKRRTYDVGSDKDGYEYYMKPTINCISCRDRQYETCKRYRRRKYPDLPELEK